MTNTYDPNSPQPLDALADSQVDMLANFTKMAEVFSNNHIALDSSTTADRGKHTYVELVQKVKTPQNSTTNVALYSKEGTDIESQLFYLPKNPNSEIQLTNYQNYSVSTDDSRLFTFLPGGYIIYFGFFTMTSEGPFQFELKPRCKTIDAFVVSPKLPASQFVAPFVQTTSKKDDDGTEFENVLITFLTRASGTINQVMQYTVIGKL